ncbi:MAG: hypothetical protein IIU58_04735 [Clostridia bacterium]|nr:hypothetical protein [Clostridia bacterium]
MGYFSENQIELQDEYSDQSYHGFEEQLRWRYENLRDRHRELLDVDAPACGDDYFSKDDYRYAPIEYFTTLADVYHAMGIAKEDLEEKCDIIVREDGSIAKKDDDEEDPNQNTMFEIVLLPTWFQTAVAA